VTEFLSFFTTGPEIGFKIAFRVKIKTTLIAVRNTGNIAILVIALHKVIVNVFANIVINTNDDSFTTNFSFEVIEYLTTNFSNRNVITLNNAFIRFVVSSIDFDSLQNL
jgi:hypothetical protein